MVESTNRRILPVPGTNLANLIKPSSLEDGLTAQGVGWKVCCMGLAPTLLHLTHVPV
jgi:hypothetical protein